MSARDSDVCAWCRKPGGDRCERPTALEAMGDDGTHFRVHVRCKTWRCTHCGTINREITERRIEAGVEMWSAVEEDVTGVLLTLTWDPRVEPNWRWDDLATHKRANALLNQWQQAIKRQFGIEVVARVAANEPHKNGRLHGHAYLLMLGDHDSIPKCDPQTRGGLNAQRKRRGEPAIPKGECYCSEQEPCAQRIAHRLGIGWINLRYESRSGRTRHGLAKYPAKYCAKSIGLGDWPRYAHRVRFSRNFSPSSAAEMRQIYADEARERMLAEGKAANRPEDLSFRALDFWGSYAETLDGSIWHRDELTELISAGLELDRGPPF